jgi:hypothetical protein
VVREIRAELGLPQPPAVAFTEAEFEHVYDLHATIFYLGVRKWIYGMDLPEEIETSVARQVAAFLDGVPQAVGDLVRRKRPATA